MKMQWKSSESLKDLPIRARCRRSCRSTCRSIVRSGCCSTTHNGICFLTATAAEVQGKAVSPAEACAFWQGRRHGTCLLAVHARRSRRWRRARRQRRARRRPAPHRPHSSVDGRDGRQVCFRPTHFGVNAQCERSIEGGCLSLCFEMMPTCWVC